MNQYLLSVWHVEGEEAPTAEEMQQIFKDVDAFNEKVADIQVFARRPAHARHRDRRARPGR